MISHPWTILTSPSSNKHHRMLLHIMTLSRNITRNHSASTQSNSRRLPFCGIGLLGLGDPNFQTDAFQFGGEHVAEGGRDGFTCALSFSASLY